MNDLVRFTIPAGFISSRVALTTEELVCGYRKGWLSSAALAELARDGFGDLPDLPTEEEMPYLLPSEVEEKVRAAVSARDDVDCADPELGKVWRYLALARLNERRDTISGFWDVIEMLWSDLGYPEEMEPFIYHIPPPPGEEFGEPAMLRRLESHLSERADWYRTRGDAQRVR
ncbi:DUF2247 family protein [Sphaerisporangium sp. NPDC049003]|uniref:DUF2247 family protein n=1 Tax=Sphaerisporangium sp. NPDC049003 TaxID=3364517 RepID=UPI0037181DF4